jgi:RNA polymerase sigma factor (sigma-70 family)
MLPDEHVPTRASLLERLKDLGDEASWIEFYQTYRGLIYSSVRRAGLNELEANEVVQDTLISVAKKIPGFTYDPAKDSFKGWLLTVTRWRVYDKLKSLKRDLSHGMASLSLRNFPSDETATVEKVPDPEGSILEAIWNEEWEKHLLQQALSRVKRQVRPQQYEIYHVYVVLGKPVHEVKKTAGVSTAQVYLAKHRVGASLRREFKRLQQGQ